MILQFIKTNILSKKLRNFLTIFSILVSVMLIIMVQNLTAQLKSNVVENAGTYDILVGANGSATQLVLSSMFYYDNPIGNINISYYENLQKDSRIVKVVPIGMGDNYNGYKIIGTSTDFFDDGYELKAGTLFEKEGDVVIGSTVARATGLSIGSTFSGMHGLTESGGHEHADFKYTVVGILAQTKTPSDTVIYTDIQSVWAVHGLEHDHDHEEGEEHDEETLMAEEMEHEEEEHTTSGHGTTSSEDLITALLVKTTSLANQVLVTNELSKNADIQAINPAATLRRLLVTLNAGEVIVTLVAYVSIFLSVIVLFTTMLSASIERRKDISILRALGANRKTVFLTILLETLIIALIGAILGFVIAHLAIGIAGNYTAVNYGINISGFSVQTSEIFVLIGAVLLSVLAGIIPAVMVYRTDATKYLK
ncbi:MAG: ABC transporter permease [Clostridia bacterium]|nr:ABC transporter permease [Clostridia bacterium]